MKAKIRNVLGSRYTRKAQHFQHWNNLKLVKPQNTKMSRLQEIHVENFKSYRGFQRLGPLTDFTCVIGPNGAGLRQLRDLNWI